MNDGTPSKFVDGNTLLETVFDEPARPSIRWLRNMVKAGTIPSHPVGRRVFFDPDEVRAAILCAGRKTKPKSRPVSAIQSIAAS